MRTIITDWNQAGLLLRGFKVTIGFGHISIADGDWYAYADLKGIVNHLSGYGHSPDEAVGNLAKVILDLENKERSESASEDAVESGEE